MADLESSFSTEQPQQAASAPAVSQPPPVSAVSVSEEHPPLTTTARPSQAMPVVAYPCQAPPSADQASRPVAAYSPPHHYQGQQPDSTAFGSSSGGVSFDQNTQMLVMASLSIFSGVIGLVACIVEAVGIAQLNNNDNGDDDNDDDDYAPVGPGISGGVLGIGVAIFAAIILIQVIRYRIYGQDAITVNSAIACQVVVLTNWMGFLAAGLTVAGTFSALLYEAFPGAVNCALLLLMALLNFAGAVIGCFTTCSTQCGGCCEGCFTCLSAGSYQRLVNGGYDGPMQTRAYGTFASDVHRQAAPPPSNPNTWQPYQQQTPHALTGQSSDGALPQPGSIQVAQPISRAQIPHALNGHSSNGVWPRPGTIPVAQPIHSHAQPSSQTSTLASVETTSDDPNGGPADALGEDGQPQ